MRIVLQAIANRPIDCTFASINWPTGTSYVCPDGGEADWNYQLVQRLAAALSDYPTPVGLTVGSLFQLGDIPLSAPLDVLMQCGPGPLGFGVCPADPPPISATGYMVASMLFDRPLVTAQDGSTFTVTTDLGNVELMFSGGQWSPLTSDFEGTRAVIRGNSLNVFVPFDAMGGSLTTQSIEFSMNDVPLEVIGDPPPQFPAILFDLTPVVGG